MSTKTPAAIAALLTVVILILLAGLFVLFQMIALNGASERQGVTAMGIALACQSLVVIFLGIFAARATDFLIKKVSWNQILAVVTTVMVATAIGGTISFLASIIAIPVAGIR
jgi:membrane protease YdiL (CAAX protease family)